MARKIMTAEPVPSGSTALANKLAEELQKTSESAQPLIYEYELGPDRLRVIVVWDQWDHIPLEQRTSVIIKAYEVAEGMAYRDKIALASGVTVPEATAANMLPYQVGTALRKGDPVSYEQCRDAMIAEGGSTLFGPDIVQLRFATEAEAQACRQRLIKRLPKSDDVWVVNREILVQDFGLAHEQSVIEKA